jgi:hypothetical protein
MSQQLVPNTPAAAVLAQLLAEEEPKKALAKKTQV